MLNKPLLRMVREAIVDHRKKFRYNVLVYPRNSDSQELLDDSCGTLGCVAGFTVAVAGEHAQAIVAKATSILGLTSDEAGFLFFCRPRFGFEEVPSEVFRDQKRGLVEALKRIDFLLNREAENYYGQLAESED